jgi:filamentous hemagglutinin
MPQSERTKAIAVSKVIFSSVMLASTLSLSFAGAATAGEFRDFKTNNPGFSNRALREMYRSQVRTRAAETSTAPLSTSATRLIPDVSNAVKNQNPRHDIRIHRQTMQFDEPGRLTNARQGVDLDLDSSSRTIVLGGKLFERVQSVTIDRAGENTTLTAGSQVTAAEYIAVKQIILGGSQTVQLDSSGRAVGGNIDLSSITARNDRLRADDLTVPLNVTAVGDFSGNPTFQVLGDLVNAGSIYAETSRRGGASRGAISAANLTNQSTGVITSVPRASDGVVDLTLQVDEKLQNFGTISSSGALILSAGTIISNEAGAQLTGKGDIALSAPTIVNNGSLRSLDGNVGLNAPSALLVDNRNGNIIAQNGSIDIRDRSFKDSADTYVFGGNLLSRDVNVNTGQGTADITVRQLTGRLNQTGLASHVSTETGVLSLGNICLSGDPTYKNANGGIVITGSITVGETLTLIADGDITNSVPVTITAGDGTGGYDITMIAGANITSGSPDTTTVGPIPPPQSGSTATTISGTVGTGGNIILGETELLPVIINARSTTGNNNNGGNVLMAAYDAAGAAGRIDLSFTQINTGGKGTGNNGNVTLIAGGNPVGATIKVGGIDTTGGNGTGGNVTISSFTPVSSNGNPITYNANGVRTSAGQLIAGPTSGGLSAHILINGNILTAGGIDITSGQDGNITVGEFDITCRGSNSTVNLTATGLGNISGSAFTTISCDTLNLLVGTGDIGDLPENTPIFTDATTITANGDTSSTDVLLQTFNPGLNVFSGSAFTMNVATQGPILADPDAGPITAETLLIGSFSGSAGLSAQHPLEVDATFLFVAGLGGDVFVHNNNTGQTNLTGGQALQASGTLSITSDGTIGLGAGERIQAKNVILQPASEFLNLVGKINGSTSVSLISNLAIDPANISADITTPVLNVTSLTSSVGIDATNRFQPSAGVGGVAAFAPNGAVFLQGAATSKAGLAGGFANGLFDYRGTGSTTISGNISTAGATGDINVIINGPGTLAVNQNVVLNASKNMTLLITDPAGSTKQKLTVGKNAALQTQDGAIALSVGVPSLPVAGTAPTKGVGYVAVSPGQIFWGDFGITGKGVNSVLAKGKDVIFSNTIKSSAISLSGGVAIVSDTP